MIEFLSGSNIIMALVVLILTWVGIRFLTQVLDGIAERFVRQRLVIKRLIPVIKILGWAVATWFIIAGIFSPPMETVLAVSASVGIAVGFASQDILKNIFGGIMIILDKPFQVGDKIAVDGEYGEVVEIGLRSTRFVTDDDSMIVFPNGELMNKAVTNSNGGALDCQVVAELYLPGGTDTAAVIPVFREVAATSKYVYLGKPIAVHAYHETAGPRDLVKFRIKAYVYDIRQEFRFRSDMTERALQEARRHGWLSEPD